MKKTITLRIEQETHTKFKKYCFENGFIQGKIIEKLIKTIIK